jgi:hypothetical protein
LAITAVTWSRPLQSQRSDRGGQVLAAIGDMGGPQLAKELLLETGPTGGDHDCPGGRRQLDRQCAHAAGGPGNQHQLTRLQLEGVHGLNGGGAGQAQRPRHVHVQPLG